MASTVSKVKTIRIKNETEEFFRDKPLNKYVDSLYEHVISGDIELKEDSVCVYTKAKEPDVDVHTAQQYESLSEIESICAFFEIDTDDFLRGVLKKLQSGGITCEGGDVKTYGEVDYSRFEEACHEKNVPIEKAIEKCAQMILRS